MKIRRLPWFAAAESARGALLFVLAGCGAAEPLPVDSPPRTPVAVEAPAPKPPAPKPPARVPTLPPLAPDQIPARLGTPEASRAAAPWWGGGASGYAPQAQGAWSLFDAAESATRDTGPLTGEMLACAVTVIFVEDKLPLFGANHNLADLTARVGFGAHVDVDREPLLDLKGPEDRNEMRFTAPIVNLRIGDPIVARVFDRDVFSNNGIELLRGRFDGKAPIVIRGKHAALDCRLVPRAAVEAKAAAALAQLDATIAGFDRDYAPRFDEPSFFGRLSVTDSTPPFYVVAALVGWDDPRVAARSARMATLERRFDDELAAELQKIHAALPAPGAWLLAKQGTRGVRATSFECGDEVHAPPDTFHSVGCLLHLEVKNLAAAAEDVPVYESGVDDLDLAIIDRRGRRHPVYLLGKIEGGVYHENVWRQPRPDVAPGAVVELLYRVPVEDPYSDSYFSGTLAPLAKDLARYEPVLIEAHAPRTQGEKVERYLRVK
jgi:hypothetical protein